MIYTVHTCSLTDETLVQEYRLHADCTQVYVMSSVFIKSFNFKLMFIIQDDR